MVLRRVLSRRNSHVAAPGSALVDVTSRSVSDCASRLGRARFETVCVRLGPPGSGQGPAGSSCRAWAWRTTAPLCGQWHHIRSLKSATVGVFSPWEPANVTGQSPKNLVNIYTNLTGLMLCECANIHQYELQMRVRARAHTRLACPTQQSSKELLTFDLEA